MKRKLTFISTAFLLSAAFTLVACGGNDDEGNNTTGITPDGKVDVTRAVEFKVNFGDYNSEEEVQGTRAAKAEGSDTLSREYVELSNGLLAEVTVQKDTEKTPASEQRPMTRALADDTYTMLAYKNGVYQGMVAGTVSSGVFTANPGAADGIVLAAGETYDFVLFNSKVTRSGDNLTVNLSDVQTALIGRTTSLITVPPIKQQVTFNMKHAGSRMRIKLTGYMPFTTSAMLSSVDAASVPNTAVYNAANDSWSNGTTAATSDSLTFPASSQGGTTYIATSNDYQYFLPSTDPSKFKLKFASGSIYNLSMANAEMTLSVPTLLSMAANASYVINVKLMYQFLYLMSDGTTGAFKATTYGGGSKTPIGVVVSRSNRLAVALKDANNGTNVLWDDTSTWYTQKNYRQFNYGDAVNSYNDLDGYKYTWEASGSADGSTIKANQQTDFPAFYHAGNYGSELSAELTSQGKALSGGMETKKWHLPSNGEWKYVFTALGFGDGTALTTYWISYNWYGNLADVAFTQVGGTTMLYKWYWSSSEFDSGNVGYVNLVPRDVSWYTLFKGALCPVRAFVAY